MLRPARLGGQPGGAETVVSLTLQHPSPAHAQAAFRTSSGGLVRLSSVMLQPWLYFLPTNLTTSLLASPGFARTTSPLRPYSMRAPFSNVRPPAA